VEFKTGEWQAPSKIGGPTNHSTDSAALQEEAQGSSISETPLAVMEPIADEQPSAAPAAVIDHPVGNGVPSYTAQDHSGESAASQARTPGYPAEGDCPKGKAPGYPSVEPFRSKTPGYPAESDSLKGKAPGYPGGDAFRSKAPGYPAETDTGKGKTPSYQGGDPFRSKTPGYPAESDAPRGKSAGYPREYPAAETRSHSPQAESEALREKRKLPSLRARRCGAFQPVRSPKIPIDRERFQAVLRKADHWEQESRALQRQARD